MSLSNINICEDYRKLITDILPSVKNEMVLHDMYVMALTYYEPEKRSEIADLQNVGKRCRR